MKQAKRRVWSILLACVMLLTMLPAGAWAADGVKEVADSGALLAAFEQDGEVRLTADITLTTSLTVEHTNTLDLNGYHLNLGAKRINVQPNSNLTISDGSADGKGSITSSLYAIVVWPSHSDDADEINGHLVITGGQISGDSIAVFNGGDFELQGGKLISKGSGGTGVYSSANAGNYGYQTQLTNKITNVMSGGEIEAEYGVALFGRGIPEGNLANIEYDAVQFTMTDGVIRAEMGVSTNASAGETAGNIIQISGGEIISSDEGGAALYLPAIGKTTISGGKITGAQAIRICAGELNITGGTITGTSAANQEDLVPGGAGGTAGAIVVGKASTGYIGDIEVNISGDAVIQNTSTPAQDEAKPAIVVSDKGMTNGTEQTITGSNGTFKYSETAIIVNVDGANGLKVEGDVIKTSTVADGGTTPAEPDGGNVSLNLKNAVIDGDLVNNSTSTGISMEGGSVKNITNSNKGSITVNQAQVSGEVSNTGSNEAKGQITLIGCETTATSNSGENITVISAVEDGKIVSTNGETYTDLTIALKDAKPGDTLYLGKGTFTATADNQFVIDENAVTLVGQGEKTVINADKYRVYGQAGFVVQADDVTIKNVRIVSGTPDGNASSDALKFTLKNDNGTYRVLEGGRVENVTLYSETGHGLNIHGVDGMVVDGVTVEQAGKLSMAISSSPDVRISKTTTAKTTWGQVQNVTFDIGVMYKDGDPNYPKVTHVMFGEGNNFANEGTFYSKYRTDARLRSGAADSVRMISKDNVQRRLLD